MAKFITRVVWAGTKKDMCIPGGNIDAIMLKIRKMRGLRDASVFLFYNRKGQHVGSRIN